jgi:hypothetical protein
LLTCSGPARTPFPPRRPGALALALAAALLAVSASPAGAQAPAHKPDAVAASNGAACYGQLVALAAQPHEGFTGHGLAHDAPGHGFDTTAALQEWLRSLCS